jgi:HEAT repeat protein
VGFNLIAAASKVPSPSALVAGLMRRKRVRAQARIKRRFTQALVLAGNGKRSPFLVRRLTSFEHRLLIVAAIELLRVMRGAPAARIVRLLGRYQARETLGLWMEHTNPALRLIAAEGLGHMGDSQGCLTLGRALHDPDRNVRLTAAESLIKLGVAPSEDELKAVLDADGVPSARLWRMLDMMRAHHPDPAKRVVPRESYDHELPEAAAALA